MKKETIKAIAISVAKEETPVSVVNELFKQITNEERVLFNDTFHEAMESIRAKRRREHERRMKELDGLLEEAILQETEIRRKLASSRSVNNAYICLMGEA